MLSDSHQTARLSPIYQDLVTAHPLSAAVQVGLACSCQEQSPPDPGYAIAHYRQAAEVAPEVARYHIDLADALIAEARYPEGIAPSRAIATLVLTTTGWPRLELALISLPMPSEVSTQRASSKSECHATADGGKMSAKLGNAEGQVGEALGTIPAVGHLGVDKRSAVHQRLRGIRLIARSLVHP